MLSDALTRTDSFNYVSNVPTNIKVSCKYYVSVTYDDVHGNTDVLYCGITNDLMRHLQLIQNAVARLVMGTVM